MQRLLLGLIISLALGGTAIAKDFIVVASTDPSIRTGQSLDAGARVALGAGRSLTLMRPSGEVITLKGAASGVVLPANQQADNSNFEAVQALFGRPPSGHAFGARRGFCPGPEPLDSIDAIVRSDQAGCQADARAALIDYLKAHGVSAADADSLYANTVVGSPSGGATP